MAYHNANTLRAILTFRPASRVFGPSPLDHALGAWRCARDQVPGHEARILAARTGLGRANRTRPENRRRAQSDAFRALNAARADLRRARAARDAAGTALLALGGTLEPARMALDPFEGFEGVRIEDDPDMAAFMPRSPASPIASARATARA